MEGDYKMDAYCHRCKKVKDVSTCGKCRKITKSDLVKILFGDEEPVYLDEGNRKKDGRKKIHTGMTRRTIAYEHKMGKSYRDLGDKYHISSTSVYRYYQQFKNVLR